MIRLTPRSRAWILEVPAAGALVVVVGLASAVAAVLAGCGSSASGPSATALRSVLRAASVSSSRPGYRFEVAVGNDAGEPGARVQSYWPAVDLADSASDNQTSTSATETGSVIAPGQWSVEVRTALDERYRYLFDRGVSYVNPLASLAPPSPFLGPAQPVSHPWAELDANADTKYLSIDNEDLAADFGMLDYLMAASSAAAIETQRVDGVATTRYRIVANLGRLPSVVAPDQRREALLVASDVESLTGHPTVAIDAWIDRNQLVRRLRVHFRECTAASSYLETITVDFLDYGRQPALAIPPPSQVTRVSGPRGLAAVRASPQQDC